MLPVTINSQEKGKEKQNKTLHLPLLFITELLYSLRNYNTCRMNKSLIFLSVFQSLQTYLFSKVIMNRTVTLHYIGNKVFKLHSTVSTVLTLSEPF